MKKKGCKFFCFAVVDATLEVYVAEFMTCFHFFFPLPPPQKKSQKSLFRPRFCGCHGSFLSVKSIRRKISMGRRSAPERERERFARSRK